MKYDQTIKDKIIELYASGNYIIKDLCKIAGISEVTFFRWKREHSDFSDSLKEVEQVRLANFQEMAKSGLAKLLDVHVVEEVTKEISQVPLKRKDPISGKMEFQFDERGNVITKSFPAHVKTVKKHFMPNATAVIFTLKNLDPENFPDTAKLDHTTAGKPINSIEHLLTLSPEQLRQRKAEIEAKLKNNG